jgi:pyruvate dehydrogenase E2 component (dihydrolipoamide acetyltransferase)
MGTERSIQGVPVARIIPLKGVKKMIAEHLLRSHLNCAELTSMTEMNVTGLVQLRQQLRAQVEEREGVRITYTCLFIKAVAQALKDCPLLNSTVEDGQILVLGEINVGVAVSLPDNLLVVPVIREADTKSLIDVARELEQLVAKAQAGKLELKDMRGGTFTLTNIGMYGTDSATPIINEPQTAIIGMGRMVEKPAFLEGEIVPQSMMWASVTVDHRVAHGVDAAQFMQRLATLFLSPEMLELGLPQ